VFPRAHPGFSKKRVHAAICDPQIVAPFIPAAAIGILVVAVLLGLLGGAGEEPPDED
jgi:hypothetical protein